MYSIHTTLSCTKTTRRNRYKHKLDYNSSKHVPTMHTLNTCETILILYYNLLGGLQCESHSLTHSLTHSGTKVLNSKNGANGLTKRWSKHLPKRAAQTAKGRRKLVESRIGLPKKAQTAPHRPFGLRLMVL